MMQILRGQARVKAKKPKARTGCWTCRARRVKCDEKKPACGNCTNHGRPCAGYPAPTTSRDDPVTAYRVLQPKDAEIVDPAPVLSTVSHPWYLVLKDLSLAEGQALAFFRHHTARQLRGSSPSQIWERWAMQLSVEEPSVLHGLVALGAIHRSKMGHESCTDLDIDSEKDIALHQYGKAISQLRTRLASSQTVTAAVIMSCLIFFCFEVIHGEGTVAMQHLQTGLRLIDNNKPASGRPYNTMQAPVVLRSDSRSPMDDLTAAFAMLDYDNAMFSFSRTQSPLVLAADKVQHFQGHTIPLSFASIAEARVYFNVLANEVFRLRMKLSTLAEQAAKAEGRFDRTSPQFWAYVHTSSYSVDLKSDDERFHDKKRQLECEIAEFSTALVSLRAREHSRHDRTLMALEAQTILVTFHIMTCRSTFETACDAFDSRFQYAVDLAERYIHMHSPADKSRLGGAVFVLEPGVIPTLCLVAAKCRTRTTRHRAINLLKRSSHLQEALWNSTAFGTFVEHLASIEEERALQLTGKTSRDELTRSSDIPEEARFMDINLIRNAGGCGKSKTLCARYAHELDGSIVFFEQDIDV